MKKKFLTKMMALALVGTMAFTSSMAVSGPVEAQAAEPVTTLGTVIGAQGIGPHMRWLYYSDTQTLVAKARGEDGVLDATGINFDGVTGIKKIYVCDGVTSIGNNTFSALKGTDVYVRVPSTVTSIGASAFDVGSIGTMVVDTSGLSGTLAMDASAFGTATVANLIIKGTKISSFCTGGTITSLYLPDFASKSAFLTQLGVEESALTGVSHLYAGDDALVKTAKINADDIYVWDDDSSGSTTIDGKYYFTVPISGPGKEDKDSNFSDLAESLGYTAMISLPTTVQLEYVPANTFGWQTAEGYAYESGDIYAYGGVGDDTLLKLSVIPKEDNAIASTVHLYNSSNVAINFAQWDASFINLSSTSTGVNPVKLGIYISPDSIETSQYGSMQLGGFTYSVKASGLTSRIDNGLIDDEGNSVADWNKLTTDGFVTAARGAVEGTKTDESKNALSGILVIPATMEDIVVTSIKAYGFQKYTNLSRVIIPSGVTSIGGSAFDGCTGLTSVKIPSSVTEIGSYAFNGCTSLTSIVYDGTQAEWEAIDKGSNWNNNCSALVVTCSDGSIE